MPWRVILHDEFEAEFADLVPDVQDELLAMMGLLAQLGPQAGRPRVDTLNGSKHANMKELRFSAGDGEWRAAFGFDRKRQAVVLVAGDKSGVSQKKFYRSLIATADRRFSDWLGKEKQNGSRTERNP